MKNKRNVLYSLIIMLAGVIYFPVQAQEKNGIIKPETKDVSASHGPNTSVRTIRQDRKGNMLLVSIEGIIRYDGKSFTNLTSKIGSHKFWDVLEDRHGNLWFASVDSGVYYYNGKSLPARQAGFQYFTTRDGLASNRVFEIYEDKAGIIWFGTGDGASRYDGKSFQNFKMKDAPAPAKAADSARAPVYHKELYHPELYEVYWMINQTNNCIHTIIEDKTGKIWFGTWSNAGVYDGKTITTITNKDGKPFTNVRSMVKDKKAIFGSVGVVAFGAMTAQCLPISHEILSVISTKTGKETFGPVHKVIPAQNGCFRAMIRNPCLVKTLL